MARLRRKLGVRPQNLGVGCPNAVFGLKVQRAQPCRDCVRCCPPTSIWGRDLGEASKCGEWGGAELLSHSGLPGLNQSRAGRVGRRRGEDLKHIRQHNFNL